MPKAYIQPGPVARTLELVGERWTILILQELLRGSHRFAKLKESVGGIAPNVLSDRLKVLEAYEIVERRFYSEHPPRAEYHLTKKGHELGIVAKVNSDPNLLHLPKVEVISDGMGVPLVHPLTVDLSRADPVTGKFRKIIKTTDAQKYGIRVSDYLLA